MPAEGSEPSRESSLIWIVTHADYWSDLTDGPSSNYYKKKVFSLFLEDEFSVKDALALPGALDWGDKPYGIVRVIYRDVTESGFIAHFAEEFGISAHLNAVPNPESTFGKKTRAKKLCERSKVVIRWGRTE